MKFKKIKLLQKIHEKKLETKRIMTKFKKRKNI